MAPSTHPGDKIVTRTPATVPKLLRFGLPWSADPALPGAMVSPKPIAPPLAEGHLGVPSGRLSFLSFQKLRGTSKKLTSPVRDRVSPGGWDHIRAHMAFEAGDHLRRMSWRHGWPISPANVFANERD